MQNGSVSESEVNTPKACLAIAQESVHHMLARKQTAGQAYEHFLTGTSAFMLVNNIETPSDMIKWQSSRI